MGLCSSCCGSFIAVIPMFSHGVFVAQASLELTAMLPQFLGAGIAEVSSCPQICTPLTAESEADRELMEWVSSPVRHPPLCPKAGSWEKVAQTLREKA